MRFQQLQYSNERELETMATENKHSLFGERIIYFPRQIISSQAGISKIPDGLFLSLDTIERSKLWIVEYELANHDFERHIFPQILGFLSALKNESTKKRIKEMMFNTIKKQKSFVDMIKQVLPHDEEIYHFLELIVDRSPSIVIVIDKKSPELEELVDQISTTTKVRSSILEFITYAAAKAGKKIHLMDTLDFRQVQSKRLIEDNKITDNWDSRLSKASNEVQNLVNQIITRTENEVQCIGKPWFKWYGFYLSEPIRRKTLFAVIIVGKNTSSICFRIDPNKFDESSSGVRNVNGFFFPTGTERRIHLSHDKIDQVINYIKYSYNITKNI